MNKVIIDTDGGADDLIAIILAIVSPEINVSAIVTSYGAYPEKESFERIFVLLRSLSPKNQINIIRGSQFPLKRMYKQDYSVHGKNSLKIKKNENDIVTKLSSSKKDNLINDLNELDGIFTYICIGPLTNLSKILSTQFAAKIKKIVMLGGALH